MSQLWKVDPGWDTMERSYNIYSVASVFKMLDNLRRFFVVFFNVTGDYGHQAIENSFTRI